MIDPADVRDEIQRLREAQAQIRAFIGHGETRHRHLARSVLRVTEQERRRLARDLHDGVGQKLGAALHRLEQLEDDLAGPLRERAAAVAALLRDSLEEIRALSRAMRPGVLDDLGLAAALQWLARRAGDTHGFEVTCDVGNLPAFGEEIETALFRIAQEALNNIGKHARASQVVVRLMVRGDAVVLLVADDGQGVDLDAARAKASQGESSGLSGMQERAALLGGTLELHSAPNDGMQVRVRIPRTLPGGDPAP